MSQFYTEMGTRRPCPLFPRHRMVDKGRVESLFGDVAECACGVWRLVRTDEFKARIAAEREATG